MQQFDELNQSYETLENEYRLYKNVRRRETFDSAAVTLLEDKLKAKQREIDRQVSFIKQIYFYKNSAFFQRQTIEVLEKQIQSFRINR